MSGTGFERVTAAYDMPNTTQALELPFEGTEMRKNFI
jgi:hypothetical protein